MLALKGNQGNLFEDVRPLFVQAQSKNFQGIEHDFYQTLDGGHSRLEKRRCWSHWQVEWLLDAEKWMGKTCMVMVESIRHSQGQTSREVRYYISSLAPDAQRTAVAIRNH